jgi:hypothetical protein
VTVPGPLADVTVVLELPEQPPRTNAKTNKVVS